MAKRKIALAAVAFLTALSAAQRWAEPDYSVDYPQGYRQWTHVMSTVIGPQSPAHAKSGGLHNFYANEKAVEGYRSGKFPDGSVLIDERNTAVDDAGVTRGGDFVGIAVMVKDSQRYAETGGWGFEVFQSGNQAAGVLNAQRRMACFTCHQQRQDHDLVFSELRASS